MAAAAAVCEGAANQRDVWPPMPIPSRPHALTALTLHCCFRSTRAHPATSAPGLGSLLPHLTQGSLPYVQGPGADVGGDEASPGADVARPSPSPGADVAWVRPFPHERPIPARNRRSIVYSCISKLCLLSTAPRPHTQLQRTSRCKAGRLRAQLPVWSAPVSVRAVWVRLSARARAREGLDRSSPTVSMTASNGGCFQRCRSGVGTWP